MKYLFVCVSTLSSPIDETRNKKYCVAVIFTCFYYGGGRWRAENLYWVGIAAPLANDRAKAARFGFAFVSCRVKDYDVSAIARGRGGELS